MTQWLDGKRVVFFDAGSTLLQSSRPIADVYYDAADRLQGAPERSRFDDAFGATWPKITAEYRSAYPDFQTSDELERDAWRRFTLRLAEQFPALLSKQTQWLDAMAKHFARKESWEPIDGANEVLERLRDDGRRLAILSNWDSTLHTLLAAHGISQCCEFVLTSAEVGHKKPHPKIFDLAIERMGVGRDEAIHIGDSLEDDVGGARGASIDAILFDPGEQHGERSVPDGVPRLRRLADLVANAA